MHRGILPVLTLLMVFCQSASYGASVQAGDARLASLQEQVVLSREAHQTAVTQFQTDRQTLASLISAKGESLQPIYAAAFTDYRTSSEVAVTVSDAIAELNQHAIAIFEQWRDEIGYLTDARLKADNEAQFATSWQGYQSLIDTLHQSEAMIDPVLAELKVNVISLKYNLSESNVAAKKPALLASDNNIEALIAALNASIASLDGFLSEPQ